MVAMYLGETRKFEGPQKVKIGETVEKAAVKRAKSRHERDTRATTELLRDEEGNVVTGPDGRPVEKIMGPLTKPGVASGRYFDVHGRREEIRAGNHALENAVQDREARARAFYGHPTDFVVGGGHQWSQNIAYGGEGGTAGTTYLRGPYPGHPHTGPNATQGPPTMPGGGGAYGPGMPGYGYDPGFGNVAEGWGQGSYPMEFQKRAPDYEAAYQNATHPLAKAMMAPGMWGQRAANAVTRWERGRDEAKGMVRPVIGYRPQGGGVNFSLQQFHQGPTQGGPPAPTNPFPPAPPHPPTAPPTGPAPTNPFPPPPAHPPTAPPTGPAPTNPFPPTPAPTGPPPPKGPQPTTTPFTPPPPAGGPGTSPFRPPPPPPVSPTNSPSPTNPFPPPPPQNPPPRKPPPPPTNPFTT